MNLNRKEVAELLDRTAHVLFNGARRAPVKGPVALGLPADLLDVDDGTDVLLIPNGLGTIVLSLHDLMHGNVFAVEPTVMRMTYGAGSVGIQFGQRSGDPIDIWAMLTRDKPVKINHPPGSQAAMIDALKADLATRTSDCARLGQQLRAEQEIQKQLRARVEAAETTLVEERKQFGVLVELANLQPVFDALQAAGALEVRTPVRSLQGLFQAVTHRLPQDAIRFLMEQRDSAQSALATTQRVLTTTKHQLESTEALLRGADAELAAIVSLFGGNAKQHTGMGRALSFLREVHVTHTNIVTAMRSTINQLRQLHKSL